MGLMSALAGTPAEGRCDAPAWRYWSSGPKRPWKPLPTRTASSLLRPIELSLPQPVDDPLHASRQVPAIGAERESERVRRELLRLRGADVRARESALQLGIARVDAQGVDRASGWRDAV